MSLIRVVSVNLKYLLATCIALMMLTTPGQAQEKCGTVQYMQMLRDKKVIKQSKEEFEEWMRGKLMTSAFSTQRVQAGPYAIPVVIHVIHNGEPIGTGTNIPDEQVISQLRVLNEDFQRLNADKVNTPAEFLGVAGSLDIQFVLAKQSPEGLPTSGITRTQGSKTSWPLTSPAPDADDFKQQIWPSADYLNIWVVKSSNNVLGYAQFPETSDPADLIGKAVGDEFTDGVVIDYRVFGSIDDGAFTLDPQYNKGRSLTHEVGHFLGLRHIWGDSPGCSPDDYVNDTPIQDGPYVNQCPSVVASSDCSPSEMYMNFMDYTDDACMNIFTVGQVARMMVILDNASIPRRNSLLTSHGLEIPVCPVDAPVDATITAIENPGPVTCDGSPDLVLTITNSTCPTITELKIAYAVNGNNFTSTFGGISIPPLEQASITIGGINLPEGSSTVSVLIQEVNGMPDTDNSNSDTTFYLARNTDVEPIPLRKDFNDGQFGTWSVQNPANGLQWDITSSFDVVSARFAGPSGANGEQSWLASPVLDFSLATEASLQFDVDYSWTMGKNDRLRVLISEDCGNTYTATNIDLKGDVLQSASNGKVYLNLSPYAGKDSLRVAFVATNATGDDIYVDNIEFYVSSDPNPPEIENLYLIHYDLTLQPSVTFNLAERNDVRVAVYDMMGRKTYDSVLINVLNQTYPIQLGNFTPGVYIFRLLINNRLYTQKVLLRR